ncbi:MAG: Pentapeptide repeat protein [Cyanobacteria bacterium RYN_339]|nr:Pentapeptide repeat protein [Cyanobacteria bacterium RYN_339]
MKRGWARFLIVALLAGCAGRAPIATTADQQIGVVSARLPVRLASLQGTALAPATLLANNSSGLVSNNSGGVISNAGAAVVSNHGGTFRLADAESWTAVPSAQVVALDARRKPIPGVKAVTTDGSGRFTLENVPSNVVVTVQITTATVTLSGLCKADGTKTEVNPATTVATEHIRAHFEGNEAALAHVPLEQFRQFTISVQAVLQQDGVTIPLATVEDAGKGFDKIVQDHPELAKQEQAVAKGATEELEQARKSGDEPTPAPTSQPAATPTAAPNHPDDDPHPSPSATPPTDGQATPTPKPKPTPKPTPTPRSSGDPNTPPVGTPTPAPSATPAMRGEAARTRLLATKACPDCDLSDVNLRDQHLENADLHGAKLRDADLHGAFLNGANLQNADLSDADVHSADLTAANLAAANLRDVNARNAKFNDANLTGATISDGDWDNATLGGATWTDGHHCNAGAVETCPL